jgi:hypothetical protein
MLGNFSFSHTPPHPTPLPRKKLNTSILNTLWVFFLLNILFFVLFCFWDSLTMQPRLASISWSSYLSLTSAQITSTTPGSIIYFFKWLHGCKEKYLILDFHTFSDPIYLSILFHTFLRWVPLYFCLHLGHFSITQFHTYIYTYSHKILKRTDSFTN